MGGQLLRLACPSPTPSPQVSGARDGQATEQRDEREGLVERDLVSLASSCLFFSRRHFASSRTRCLYLSACSLHPHPQPSRCDGLGLGDGGGGEVDGRCCCCCCCCVPFMSSAFLGAARGCTRSPSCGLALSSTLPTRHSCAWKPTSSRWKLTPHASHCVNALPVCARGWQPSPALRFPRLGAWLMASVAAARVQLGSLQTLRLGSLQTLRSPRALRPQWLIECAGHSLGGWWSS